MDGGDDDDSGYVPIVEAAKRGNDELIQEYIEQGLNPKKVDALGNSALHWAAAGNHVDCINLLLKLGLDPNQPNRDGDTPLHKAAWKNYDEAAAALTANNNSIKARSMRNKDGKRPVDITNKLSTKKLVAPVMTVEEAEKESKATADRFKAPTH